MTIPADQYKYIGIGFGVAVLVILLIVGVNVYLNMAPVPAPGTKIPTAAIRSQYGATGITADPPLSATNYAAPTQWIQIGIVKTSNPDDDSFYPVYERRLVSYLDLFQYVVLLTDKNNIFIPLGTRGFIDSGVDIGTIQGMESKGTWIMDRYRNINWRYTS